VTDNRTITLTGPTGAITTVTTGPDGHYCFSALQPGVYSAQETLPVDWRETYPPTGAHSVTIAAGEARVGIDFGSLTGCVTRPYGMVAWWPLDEPKSPAITFAQDIAGHHKNRGVWTGAIFRPNTETVGKVNGAILFGPPPGDDPDPTQSVDVSDDSEIDFGTGDLSIDAWLRTSDTSLGILPILDKRDGSASLPRGYFFFLSGGQLGFQLGDGTTSPGNFVEAGASLADGAWHHVAVTVKRSSGVVTLYVDGSPVPLSTPVPSLVTGTVSNASKLRIGNVTLGSQVSFRGDLDEIEVFNRVLADVEVAAIWAADSHGKCPTGTIRGGLFNDFNGNGLRDAAELGLARWTVLVTGVVNDSTATDSTGGYFFQDLLPGTYGVTVVGRQGWDQTLPVGGSYSVTLGQGQDLAQQDFAYHRELTAVTTEGTPQPVNSLSQNQPNPFNPHTTIRFSVAREGRARLSIYDVRGALVARLVDGVVTAGEHTVGWNGLTRTGSSVGSGIYFYRLETSGAVLSRTMVLLR
jgi:hypothetical protein